MTDQQPPLFKIDPDPWEMDDNASRNVARVVFSEGLTGEFDYQIPDTLRETVQAGKRLSVPLGRGNRLVEAYCVETIVQSSADPASRRLLKRVASVIDDEPLMSASMLQLTRWMADYYLAAWGRILEAVVPAGVRSAAGVRRLVFVRPTVKAKTSRPHLKGKQSAVLDLLLSRGQPMLKSDLLREVGCTFAPVRTLQKKGLVLTERIPRLQQPPSELRSPRPNTPLGSNPVVSSAAPPELTDSQRVAIGAIADAMQRGQHRTFVLHGVTGSGKTEVYIRAIERTIDCGRQAIVLVPEIALTPQTRRRFRERFERVAVLHSHLSDAERHWHWRQIATGQVDVIVGARSAVFAPTPQLGLIVLDEEHDGSFKQDSIPRYHARTVAAKRAHMEQIPLILGSATPSLETWHDSQTGAATLLSMPDRVAERRLPDVTTVDLREDLWQRRQRGPISSRLDQAIRTALRRQQQVILLLNRRGFSTHIQCPACGHVVHCPHCELPLTHHRAGERAVCHYCEYGIKAPRNCPECRFEGIRYGGLGTQRLEEEVRKMYPEVSVLRMDSDTMRRHGSHEQSLGRFRRGEVQILVGTQMIAKGLDFPNVTVVGVINADTGLHLPDFRAAERTFQLVTQVAGRTGRGVHGGCVYLQTFNPDHTAILAAERHDYQRFADQELPIRQAFGYPPFGRLIRVIVRGPVEADVKRFSEDVGRLFSTLEQAGRCRVLGPAAAPIAKLRGHYRYHLVLQSDSLELLRQGISQGQSQLSPPQHVLWQVDVDPSEML